MGEAPFCVICPQCLAFFNEHLLLLANGEKNKDQPALIPGQAAALTTEAPGPSPCPWSPWVSLPSFTQLDSRNQEWVGQDGADGGRSQRPGWERG